MGRNEQVQAALIKDFSWSICGFGAPNLAVSKHFRVSPVTAGADTSTRTCTGLRHTESL